MVAHVASAGGISRFLIALVSHLVEVDPRIEITLFADDQMIQRDRLRELFGDKPRVAVAPIGDSRIGASTPLASGPARRRGVLWRGVATVLRRWPAARLQALRLLTLVRTHLLGQGKPWYKFAFDAETVSRLNEYDLIYFANPFFMAPVRFVPPVVATIHDLNFKHFPANYHAEMMPIVERQSKVWFSRLALAVSSTKFIRDEVEHYYPELEGRTRLVYLAPYSYEGVDDGDFPDVVRDMGIPSTYILYPTNRGAHKNVVGLLRAAAVLKKRGTPVPLVISGAGSDLLGPGGSTLSPDDTFYTAHRFLMESDLVIGEDVFPVGYVTNKQVDALTHCASVVVSPSFYEAGCGPALDAWQFGAPVAFSNIPPYLEQLEVLGTAAWVFDPHDPEDIADTIHRALTEKDETRRMVEQSREKIHDYTWHDVAVQYDAVFREAYESSKTPDDRASKGTTT